MNMFLYMFKMQTYVYDVQICTYMISYIYVYIYVRTYMCIHETYTNTQYRRTYTTKDMHDHLRLARQYRAAWMRYVTYSGALEQQWVCLSPVVVTRNGGRPSVLCAHVEWAPVWRVGQCDVSKCRRYFGMINMYTEDGWGYPYTYIVLVTHVFVYARRISGELMVSVIIIACRYHVW